LFTWYSKQWAIVPEKTVRERYKKKGELRKQNFPCKLYVNCRVTCCEGKRSNEKGRNKVTVRRWDKEYEPFVKIKGWRRRGFLIGYLAWDRLAGDTYCDVDEELKAEAATWLCPDWRKKCD
jgi:hypothetical protein